MQSYFVNNEFLIRKVSTGKEILNKTKTKTKYFKKKPALIPITANF